MFEISQPNGEYVVATTVLRFLAEFYSAVTRFSFSFRVVSKFDKPHKDISALIVDPKASESSSLNWTISVSLIRADGGKFKEFDETVIEEVKLTLYTEN